MIRRGPLRSMAALLAAAATLAVPRDATAQARPERRPLAASHAELLAALDADPQPSLTERIRLLGEFLRRHGDRSTTPEVLGVRMRLATAQLSAQRPDRALGTFQAIADDTAGLRNELHAGAVYGMYRAFLAMGDKDRARAVLEDVRKRFPNSAAARCATIALAHLEDRPPVAVGEPLPELRFGRSTQDRELRLPEDRPALLVFFSSDHSTSIKRLQALALAWQRAGLPLDDLIAFPAEPDSVTLRRLVDQRRWTFPVVATDFEGYLHPYWITLGVTGVPASFLVTAEGRLWARDLPPDRLTALLATR